MRNNLSILLPTYNCRCVELVERLHAQCRAVASRVRGFCYEIVVADDCSTDRRLVGQNGAIERLEHVRYLKLPGNIGRSAVRNFLAREARGEWLVFVDGDLGVGRADFVEKYVESEGDIVVGGVEIGGDPKVWGDNLRYQYEKRCEGAHSVEGRSRMADREFRTTNFLVARDAMLRHPFDERFRHYGYEDVLFGKSLCAGGYAIRHIDNPVLLDDFEPNAVYVGKTEEACRTLMEFSSQLRGYSSLLGAVLGIRRMHMRRVFSFAFRLFGKAVRRNLCGRKPCVRLFNIYRLLYCCTIH